MDFIGLSLCSERTILGCRLGFLQHVVVSPKQKKLSAVFEEVLLLLLINNHVLWVKKNNAESIQNALTCTFVPYVIWRIKYHWFNRHKVFHYHRYCLFSQKLATLQWSPSEFGNYSANNCGSLRLHLPLHLWLLKHAVKDSWKIVGSAWS